MMFNCIANNHKKVKWSNNLKDILSDLKDDLDDEIPLSSISDSGHFIENHEIAKSEAQKCKTVGYRTRQKVKQEQDNKLPHLLEANLIQSTDQHEIIKYRPQTYETVDYQIELDIYQDNELPLSSIADFLRPIDLKPENGESKKLETVAIQSEENKKQKIKQDNDLAQISIANFRYSINNNKIIISEAQKCKTVGYRTRQKVKQEQDNKLPHLLEANLIQSTDQHEIIKYRPQTYETVDYQIELDIYQDNELPLSSIADFLRQIDLKPENGESKKLETVAIQSEENKKQKIKQDNDLAQISITNFRYSINNNKIIISEAQKCKTVGYRTRLKVKQEQDNKLPHLLEANLIQSTDNHKIIKYRPQKYETVDYQIELDIYQDNELSLSSIADFLRPIDLKLENCESKKFETVNNKSEKNMESESDRIIFNEEQSTINNPSGKYECSICCKIFPSRTQIIKHYKTSLCYPDIIYVNDNF
ncbi:zinc finger protein 616-like [Aphis craccivora]|uniref:Zinc finger protein 616-like n=1 Tax=Aphis craccivora TaxID=307492 RepID=A0A6G0YYD8_APHCR|nr:zinc finger protein 616-like [Aphis craccivora]